MRAGIDAVRYSINIVQGSPSAAAGAFSSLISSALERTRAESIEES
jgi:hypothetical protein